MLPITDICFYIHYTLGVTFTDGHHFYSDSFSVIHSHHNLCLHIHYTFGVTFTDDYNFYSDSYSFIHRHFFVQLAICYTLQLDKSKSIITHSLHIRQIGLCIWTNQNQSFRHIALYIGQILITHKFATFKFKSYKFATHLSRWPWYLDKSKSIITHSLHIRHIGLCIWTNQNQSLHICYTFTILGSILDKSSLFQVCLPP